MGCGTSKAVPIVVDQDAPENLKEAHLISDAQEGLLTCIDSPDKVSDPVEVEESSSSSSPLAARTNGIEPSLPQANGEVLPPQREEGLWPSKLQHPRRRRSPSSRGTPRGNSRGSRTSKQQSLELTQELLEEKQVEAEKRRQEILSQRVQSAKQRTARSAGRMRTRPDDGDDVEQEDGLSKRYP
ncbi:uncharacterized protein LOC135217474 isoform X2 [Macrobrachium nipponense]|uniref:uncharacterized protein LOC135217474 isoform X2 n=1 Tax=Macrobrachium nipponense TaxID=159736 RepID=UPI0030C87902